MCYIAHQWFIWTTQNLCLSIYFYIAPRRSKKISIIFFTFVTGVKHASWCLLRPWLREFFASSCSICPTDFKTIISTILVQVYFYTPLNISETLLADLGEARGCSTNSLVINSFSEWVREPFPPTALRRLHDQTVRDSTSSYKNRLCHNDQDLSKPRRASKSLLWSKSNGHFTEGVDLAYW